MQSSQHAADQGEDYCAGNLGDVEWVPVGRQEEGQAKAMNHDAAELLNEAHAYWSVTSEIVPIRCSVPSQSIRRPREHEIKAGHRNFDVPLRVTLRHHRVVPGDQ